MRKTISYLLFGLLFCIANSNADDVRAAAKTTSDQIVNKSGVPGTNVTQALNNLFATSKLWQDRYFERSDGTVEDTATGLIWDKNANHGHMVWTDAIAYITGLNNSNYKGHNDWRLPSVYKPQTDGTTGMPELETIGRDGGIPSNAFTRPDSPFVGVVADHYWSGVDFGGAYAWYVYFLNGSMYGGEYSQPKIVWPVRGGLPISKTDKARASKDIDLNGHTIGNGNFQVLDHVAFGDGQLKRIGADLYWCSNGNTSLVSIIRNTPVPPQ